MAASRMERTVMEQARRCKALARMEENGQRTLLTGLKALPPGLGTLVLPKAYLLDDNDDLREVLTALAYIGKKAGGPAVKPGGPMRLVMKIPQRMGRVTCPLCRGPSHGSNSASSHLVASSCLCKAWRTVLAQGTPTPSPPMPTPTIQVACWHWRRPRMKHAQTAGTALHHSLPMTTSRASLPLLNTPSCAAQREF